jgi:hypothetical protein
MSRNTTRALALIAAELGMAASFALAGLIGFHGRAEAAPLPTCQYEDGTEGTACLWTVEHDGIMSLVPACAYEDGNPDGMPCLWTDPDTSTRYYVTSENYR